MPRKVSVQLTDQETVIRFDQGKGPVSIVTSSPTIRRKLERRGLTPYQINQIRGTPVSWFFRTPYPTLTWTVRRGKTGGLAGVSPRRNDSGGPS